MIEAFPRSFKLEVILLILILLLLVINTVIARVYTVILDTARSVETETLHTTRYVLIMLIVIVTLILILITGDNLAMHARAVKTHLVDLAASYILSSTSLSPPSLSSSTSPSIYIVNLIDKQGTQGKLGRLLFAAMQMVQRGGVLTFSQNSTTTTTTSSITTSSTSVLDAVSSLGNTIHYHYYNINANTHMMT